MPPKAIQPGLLVVPSLLNFTLIPVPGSLTSYRVVEADEKVLLIQQVHVSYFRSSSDHWREEKSIFGLSEDTA
ncbi:MAG: hypothetical protein KME06_09610 [Kastovskya adunca ATA6-11-RM4]|nr:hypothetical protein [Kastovskya adunca ATA6-11-RM4]